MAGRLAFGNGAECRSIAHWIREGCDVRLVIVGIGSHDHLLLERNHHPGSSPAPGLIVTHLDL